MTLKRRSKQLEAKHGVTDEVRGGPAGVRHGRAHGSMAVTDDSSRRLIRLPLWLGLTESQQLRIVELLDALDRLP
jgi:dTDP-4-amino-4,6-dideoxygalactose transaminase